MSNVVYSGEGTYDGTSLTAVYNVYLPSLTQGSYKFYTNKIYNFSSSSYPNTIMLYMEVTGATNVDLSGLTNQPATAVMFSLLPGFVVNINSTCIPLDTTKNINVIIMHDDELDTAYAMANYYNTATQQKITDSKGQESAIIKPKKIGTGFLVLRR